MPSYRNVNRRLFLRNAIAAGGAASVSGLAGCLSDIGGSGSAGAENYPQGDIEIIVPFSSGGGFDSYARLSEPYWAETLGGNVIVTNVEGGGGIVGTSQVYTENPDGQTFMIWDTYQALTQQQAQDVDYDIREMSHIGTVVQDPNALVVMDRVGLEDFDDFVARLPELSFATQGAGSAGHTLVPVLTLFLEDVAGEYLNFVHFDGTGEVLAGLERGEADVFMPATVTSAIETLESLEDASLFAVFEQEDEIGWYLDERDVSPEYYSDGLEVDDIETYNQMGYMRRFFTSPPDVPEDILEIQQNAFLEFAESEEFVEHMEESGRPVINPGGPQETNGTLDQLGEIIEQDPYASLFDEIIS